MTTPDFNALTDEEFRATVREFFAKHYPPHLRYILRRARLAEMMEWYQTLSQHGWIAPNWPREHGGMGLDTGKMIILLEEQERYGVVRVPDHGIVQVGPILMKYGSTRRRRNIICRRFFQASTSGAKAIPSPMQVPISRACALKLFPMAMISSSTVRKSGRRSRMIRRISTC